MPQFDSSHHPILVHPMSSVNPAEIALFSRHANDWWNPEGALRPLHKLNPARMTYIRDQICSHFNRKVGRQDVLKNLSVLDVGCGGGLLCEPMARLGAAVTGLDASAEAVKIARAHAKQSDLGITYVCGNIEDFARSSEKFDVITALEIIEHVADIDSFLRGVAGLLKPNGIVLVSTLNRTVKSYLLGIVAAEYVLRWVPRGTHDWRKFMRPSECAAHLQKAGLDATNITGMAYDPLNDRFCLQPEKVGMNYLMTAIPSK